MLEIALLFFIGMAIGMYAGWKRAGGDSWMSIAHGFVRMLCGWAMSAFAWMFGIEGKTGL